MQGAERGRHGCASLTNFSRLPADLPRGWEEGFTEEGASFFIE
jgi:hypothetical protein